MRHRWLEVHTLDALCELGREHGHPRTPRWADQMRDITSRTGMRELSVRAMLHNAVLGDDGDAPAAAMLASGIDNPRLGPPVAAAQ